MGEIVHAHCSKCTYEKTFFVGAGFMDFKAGRTTVLYSCPGCGDLLTITREKTLIPSKEPRCEKCQVDLVPVTEKAPVLCPECKAPACSCTRHRGCWD